MIDCLRSRVRKQPIIELYFESVTVLQHKIHVGMCVQRRLKSVCTSAHYDQSLSFAPEETMIPWLPIEDTDQTAWIRRLV